MAQAETGRDGEYRMTIENRYKQLAGVRRDSKLLAVLGGVYGLFKLGFASIPTFVYGEQLSPLYVASLVAILVAFAVFSQGSGGGKASKEKSSLLWLYVLIAAIVGSKAILDAWNNPYARAMLMMSSAPIATPYDQSVAKLMVQKLNVNPEEAVRDIDMINLALDTFGGFSFLASAAATTKYLTLKRLPGKVKKST